MINCSESKALKTNQTKELESSKDVLEILNDLDLFKQAMKG